MQAVAHAAAHALSARCIGTSLSVRGSSLANSARKLVGLPRSAASLATLPTRNAASQPVRWEHSAIRFLSRLL
eukprot:scaffold61450_cov69-Phaeocystis_antarctica.AAC.3